MLLIIQVFGLRGIKKYGGVKVFNSNSDRFIKLDQQLKTAFSKIKEEFDDHKQSINENTSELNDMNDHFAQIEEKIDKLDEKLEEFSMMIKQVMNRNDNLGLNQNEQKVFLSLYAIEETPLSYADVARKANMTELSVKACIMNLVSKGIPIIERRIDNTSYFKLEKGFKQLQAKQNIVKIDQELIKEVKLV